MQPALKLKLFGATLDELITRQKERYPALSIPAFIIFLKDTLIHLGGINTFFTTTYQLAAQSVEGIFRFICAILSFIDCIRVPGNQAEILAYREAFDNGELYIKKPGNLHTMCAVLKLFLRELATPIISREN